VIQEALTSAVRQGLIYRNPAQFVDAPPLARSEIHPLLEGQARALLAAVQGERLCPLYVAALATGMRQGELLALRWRDVDLDGRFLAVRRSVALSQEQALSSMSPRRSGDGARLGSRRRSA
jgi:integrase